MHPAPANAPVVDLPESDVAAAPFRRTDHAQLVRELSRPQPWRWFAAMVGDWSVALTTAWVAWTFVPVCAWPLAWLVIATRQHALLTLMHEGAHRTLHRHRGWNDAIANLTCAWPMLVTTASFRDSHLRHHRFTNTEHDPDLMRKIGGHKGVERWLLPRGRAAIVLDLIGVVAWRGPLDMLRKLRRFQRSASAKTPSTARAARLPRLLFHAAAAGVITWLGAWPAVACMWLVPMLTFLPALLDVRSFAEHFGLEWGSDSELDGTRTVAGGPVQRFLFGPHGICFHVEHHLFPSVPFYRLAELHRRLLRDPAYAGGAVIADGYLWGKRSVLDDLAAKGTVEAWARRSGATPNS